MSLTANSYRARNAKAKTFLFVAMTIWVLTLASGSCRREPPNHTVTLTWRVTPSTQNTFVIGYNVYRQTVPEPVYAQIGIRTPGPPFEDRMAKGGTTYVYAVTTVDQRDRESRFSSTIKVVVP